MILLPPAFFYELLKEVNNKLMVLCNLRYTNIINIFKIILNDIILFKDCFYNVTALNLLDIFFLLLCSKNLIHDSNKHITNENLIIIILIIIQLKRKSNQQICKEPFDMININR